MLIPFTKAWRKGKTEKAMKAHCLRREFRLIVKQYESEYSLFWFVHDQREPNFGSIERMWMIIADRCCSHVVISDAMQYTEFHYLASNQPPNLDSILASLHAAS